MIIKHGRHGSTNVKMPRTKYKNSLIRISYNDFSNQAIFLHNIINDKPHNPEEND